MTLQEALNILTTYHAWRIGDDEVHMQKPSEVTKAIDTLLNYHIGDVNKMGKTVTDCNVSEIPTDYIGLTDEEIMKGAEEWYEIEGSYKPSAIALMTWLNACKWYRNKLKQYKLCQ
jgi:predicted Zn-dependent protease with MMP-like domain